jgi:hypothetical protein
MSRFRHLLHRAWHLILDGKSTSSGFRWIALSEIGDVMNRNQMAWVSVLFLLVGSFGSLGCAQQQESQQQPDAVNQQEPRQRPDAVPPEKPLEAKPSQGAKPTQDDRQQQEKPPKSEKQEVPKPSKGQPKAGQEENGQHAQKGQVSKNGKSAHIPDAQFKASFGHQHTFTVNRVITQTTVVPRQTQFVSAGYTFVFLDPWPTAWLLTDDCYIDYVDDEYFLFDVLHPGIRVALFVVE